MPLSLWRIRQPSIRESSLTAAKNPITFPANLHSTHIQHASASRGRVKGIPCIHTFSNPFKRCCSLRSHCLPDRAFQRSLNQRLSYTDRLFLQRRLSDKALIQTIPPPSLGLLFAGQPGRSSIARIERALFHRARSASKKGTWPLPLLPSLPIISSIMGAD